MLMQVDDDRTPWLEAISEYKKRKLSQVEDEMAVDDAITPAEVFQPMSNIQSNQPIQFQYFINPGFFPQQNNSQPEQTEQTTIEDVEMVRETSIPPASVQISVLKLFGLFLLLFISLVAISFLMHFYNDIFFKIQHRSSQINMKIAGCAKSYLANSCSTITSTVPHMVSICNEWAECMQQDPDHVDRLSVFGEVFSSLLNAFIDPLSWKVVSVATVWILSSIYILLHMGTKS